MKKEFIPYEIALALKELGFDEPCFAHFVKHYNEIKCILNSDDFDEWWTNNSDNLECKAPLYQQVFRWFREKYNLYSFVFVFDQGFGYETYKEGVIQTNESFESYDEAQIACLDKLIELVKNK